MDTLYTFGDNSTHYKTESVSFWGLMNSATKIAIEPTWGFMSSYISRFISRATILFIARIRGLYSPTYNFTYP